MTRSANRAMGAVLTSNPVTAPLLPLLRSWRHRRRANRLYARYRKWTMIPRAQFADNLWLCREFGTLPGLVIECGVWRGGMIAALAQLLGPERTYYLFDSFEGLPPADLLKDGERAVNWMARAVSQPNDPWGTLRAEIELAEAAMRLSGARQYHLVKGWYKETLASFVPPAPIAILRLDADWYDSIRQCLEALYPHVAAGGLILIDDYYTWDGCARAVHEYLAKQKGQDRIRQSPAGVAYIIKAS